MSVKEIPLDRLKPSPFNPRTDLGDLDELAATMRHMGGVIEPIVVRPSPSVEGEYEVVVGERRVKAAKKAGLKTIVARVRKMSDEEAVGLQIVENLQRKELTPVEEGRLFRELQERFKMPRERVGALIGKKEQYVSERMALLGLPEEIAARVVSAPGGEAQPTTMTFTKALELTRLEPEKRAVLARKISEEGMTTEQLRSAVRKAREVETMIAQVRRKELREKLEQKYLPRVFEAGVVPKDVDTEIKTALGVPTGPRPERQWSEIERQVGALRRPYMENSALRTWESGDRRYIQLILWVDVGARIPKLDREDYPESRFIDFAEADNYAKERGGYCSGIVEIAGKRYWVIYVKERGR
jgi:ParB family chromosome partitioning protein